MNSTLEKLIRRALKGDTRYPAPADAFSDGFADRAIRSPEIRAWDARLYAEHVAERSVDVAALAAEPKKHYERGLAGAKRQKEGLAMVAAGKEMVAAGELMMSSGASEIRAASYGVEEAQARLRRNLIDGSDPLEKQLHAEALRSIDRVRGKYDPLVDFNWSETLQTYVSHGNAQAIGRAVQEIETIVAETAALQLQACGRDEIRSFYEMSMTRLTKVLAPFDLRPNRLTADGAVEPVIYGALGEAA